MGRPIEAAVICGSNAKSHGTPAAVDWDAVRKSAHAQQLADVALDRCGFELLQLAAPAPTGLAEPAAWWVGFLEREPGPDGALAYRREFFHTAEAAQDFAEQLAHWAAVYHTASGSTLSVYLPSSYGTGARQQ